MSNIVFDIRMQIKRIDFWIRVILINFSPVPVSTMVRVKWFAFPVTFAFAVRSLLNFFIVLTGHVSYYDYPYIKHRLLFDRISIRKVLYILQMMF